MKKIFAYSSLSQLMADRLLSAAHVLPKEENICSQLCFIEQLLKSNFSTQILKGKK